MTTKRKLALLGAVVALGGLLPQQAHAGHRPLFCRCEAIRSSGTATVAYAVPPGDCPVYSASGSAWAVTTASAMDEVTTLDFECYADPSTGTETVDCTFSLADPDSDSDYSWDLASSPIFIASHSSVESPCCVSAWCAPGDRVCYPVGAWANAEARVSLTGTSIASDHGGDPFFRRILTSGQVGPGASCSNEYVTEAFGHASYQSEASTDLTIEYDTPCTGNPTVTFELTSEANHEIGEQGDPPAMDPAYEPVLRFASITVDWVGADGQEGSITYQGVFADLNDGTGQAPIRLGQYADSEFDPIPLPDGWGVAEGSALEISVPVPAIGYYAISATSSMDQFAEFDGDVDGDGWVCEDDQTLIMDLMLDGVQINDPRYTPRADFNLNGIIDVNDTISFFMIYDELPDCDGNGNPDDCDLATGIHVDTNSNGIPDDCELAACCLDRGGCEIMTRPECEEICGRFHLDRDTCDGLAFCGLARPSWACCMPSGECLIRTECECEAYGGVFYQGSNCGSVNCNTFP